MMAHYLVRAKLNWERLPELADRLRGGEVKAMRPFGPALDDSLRRARIDEGGEVIWEEEDYCRPPLRQEQAAVLDEYFEDIRVEAVAPGEGWRRLEGRPSLWEEGPLEG